MTMARCSPPLSRVGSGRGGLNFPLAGKTTGTCKEEQSICELEGPPRGREDHGAAGRAQRSSLQAGGAGHHPGTEHLGVSPHAPPVALGPEHTQGNKTPSGKAAAKPPSPAEMGRGRGRGALRSTGEKGRR